MIDELVKNFLDEFGRLKLLPAKNKRKMACVLYVASKFDLNRRYTEKEINAEIQAWLSFDDYTTFRREMVDFGALCRTPNGSEYWLANPLPTLPE